MGGKALQSGSVRLVGNDYWEVVHEIMNLVPEIYDARFVRSHFGKEDFGDADFILRKDALAHFNIGFEGFREQIRNEFDAKEMVRNGDMLSWGYPHEKGQFQIDFVMVPDEDYWSSYNYFSFDPAGNLSGKLAHFIGVRYGHEGLWYNIREQDVGGEESENSHVMEKVILSKDINVINDFLGLWHDKWVEGFESWREIFDWIIRSEFFSHDLFALENLKHHDRVRDRKRKSYQAFIEYIKGVDPLDSYRMSRAERLDYICGNFPVLKAKLEENRFRFRVKNEVRSKFNGNLLAEWAGLPLGPELGAVMAAYKLDIGVSHYDMFFKNPQDIRDDFMQWYKYNRVMV